MNDSHVFGVHSVYIEFKCISLWYTLYKDRNLVHTLINLHIYLATRMLGTESVITILGKTRQG